MKQWSENISLWQQVESTAGTGFLLPGDSIDEWISDPDKEHYCYTNEREPELETARQSRLRIQGSLIVSLTHSLILSSLAVSSR